MRPKWLPLWSGDDLVGVSHECDYPGDVVAGKPIITRSAIPHDASPQEIDQIVRERIHHGESLYTLDFDLLESLEPDLVITQELCEVCAVSAPVVRDAMCRLSSQPQLVSLEPTNIQEIFGTLRTVANAAGVPEHAEDVIEKLQARLAQIKMRLSETSQARGCLRWSGFCHRSVRGIGCPKWWNGRRHRIDGTGGREIASAEWASILRAQPEYLFFTTNAVRLSGRMIERELRTTVFPPESADLPAVRQDNVFAVNANSYFSRPAPPRG